MKKKYKMLEEFLITPNDIETKTTVDYFCGNDIKGLDSKKEQFKPDEEYKGILIPTCRAVDGSIISTSRADGFETTASFLIWHLNSNSIDAERGVHIKFHKEQWSTHISSKLPPIIKNKYPLGFFDGDFDVMMNEGKFISFSFTLENGIFKGYSSENLSSYKKYIEKNYKAISVYDNVKFDQRKNFKNSWNIGKSSGFLTPILTSITNKLFIFYDSFLLSKTPTKPSPNKKIDYEEFKKRNDHVLHIDDLKNTGEDDFSAWKA